VYLGERSCAYVQPAGPKPTAAELRRFVRERGIAAFKVPDRVLVVERFPVTGVGKTRAGPNAPFHEAAPAMGRNRLKNGSSWTVSQALFVVADLGVPTILDQEAPRP
jgi:AMP-binding enzyme